MSTIPHFLYRRFAIGHLLGLAPSTTASALEVPTKMVLAYMPQIIARLKDAGDNIPSWVKEQDPPEPLDWGAWKKWRGEDGEKCSDTELNASPGVAIQAENQKNQHFPTGISCPSDTESDVAPPSTLEPSTEVPTL